MASQYIGNWREIVPRLNTVGPIRNIDTWVYILHSWRNQIKSKAKKIVQSGLLLSNTEQRALEVFEKIQPSNDAPSIVSDSMDKDGKQALTSAISWYTVLMRFIVYTANSSMMDVQIKQEIDSDDADNTKHVITEKDATNGNDVESNGDANDNNGDDERQRQQQQPTDAVATKRIRINGRFYPVHNMPPGSRPPESVERFKIMCKRPEKLLRPQRMATMSRQLPMQHIQQRGQVRISRITSAASLADLRAQQQQPQSHPLPSPNRQAPQSSMRPQGRPTQHNQSGQPSNRKSLLCHSSATYY